MDDWNAEGQWSGSAATRAAVRNAEQTVADAWIGRLLLAENEAEIGLGACTRIRNRVADRIRDAQQGGDLSLLVKTHQDLERADRAWGRALEDYEHTHALLEHEFAAWADATAERVRQAWADRSAFGRR